MDCGDFSSTCFAGTGDGNSGLSVDDDGDGGGDLDIDGEGEGQNWYVSLFSKPNLALASSWDLEKKENSGDSQRA